MNIFLWILQVLLALHTVIGAGWKVFNSEQSVPTLNALPKGIWMGLIPLELICAVCLINSPNSTPGIRVGIESNGPRISRPDCGLGSQRSRWLGPPCSMMKIA